MTPKLHEVLIFDDMYFYLGSFAGKPTLISGNHEIQLTDLYPERLSPFSLTSTEECDVEDLSSLSPLQAAGLTAWLSAQPDGVFVLDTLKARGLLETLATVEPREGYVSEVLSKSQAHLPAFRSAYSESHPQEVDESDDQWLRRVAEQDFADGEFQGALFPAIYD